MLKLMPLEGIWIQLSALLIILGMLVGIVGSTLSMRKFLKV
jgi:cell division transport system permease protein